MSGLETLIADAEGRFEALSREAAVAEEKARDLRIDAEKARAFADGLKAAQGLMSATRTRQKPADDPNSRNREITPVWKNILRIADDNASGLPFSYDDLADAAKETGHEIGRDTLRSQLGFVRFRSGPSPEEAVVCDVIKGLIEGQDASAHVVDIFPFPAM